MWVYNQRHNFCDSFFQPPLELGHEQFSDYTSMEFGEVSYFFIC